MIIFVVLFWSYVTIYPMLTPFILLPIFFLFAQIFRDALERVNSALVFFIAIIVIAAVTYFNVTSGADKYAEYLFQNGIETDAKVSEVQDQDVTLKFRGAAGDIEVVKYSPKKRRFYPPIEEPVVAPDDGDTVRIVYYPGVESALLVLSDPHKSTYGSKLACGEAARALTMAENAYRIQQFPSPEQRTAYRSAIENAIALVCFDTKERERYRELLSKL